MFISALKGVPAKPAAAASKPPAQIIIKTAPTQANSRDAAVVEMQKHVHDLTSALINEQEDKKQYQLEYERIQDEGRRLFTTYVAKTNRLKEVCVSFSIRLTRMLTNLCTDRRHKCQAGGDVARENYRAHQCRSEGMRLSIFSSCFI